MITYSNQIVTKKQTLDFVDLVNERWKYDVSCYCLSLTIDCKHQFVFISFGSTNVKDAPPRIITMNESLQSKLGEAKRKKTMERLAKKTSLRLDEHKIGTGTSKTAHPKSPAILKPVPWCWILEKGQVTSVD